MLNLQAREPMLFVFIKLRQGMDMSFSIFPCICFRINVTTIRFPSNELMCVNSWMASTLVEASLVKGTYDISCFVSE